MLKQVETRFSIGQLAREAGLPASTVRYYERMGLVRPDGRTKGNYRYYGVQGLERVRFIREAQAAGFTLRDIGNLFDVRDGTTAPCKEVRKLIERRLHEMERRVAELRRAQGLLKSLLKLCQRAERFDRCEVLERLDAAASEPPPCGRAQMVN